VRRKWPSIARRAVHHCAPLHVTTLCRVIGVSVSGFYAWLQTIPTVQRRAEAEAELRGHIGRIFTANLTMPFELT
jgi:hypothetical protein